MEKTAHLITPASATSLAVQYAAYVEAVANDDVSGRWVWGSMLQKTQTDSGVILISDLDATLATGRRELNKLREAEARAMDAAQEQSN